jgi:hypothetical protein
VRVFQRETKALLPHRAAVAHGLGGQDLPDGGTSRRDGKKELGILVTARAVREPVPATEQRAVGR